MAIAFPLVFHLLVPLPAHFLKNIRSFGKVSSVRIDKTDEPARAHAHADSSLAQKPLDTGALQKYVQGLRAAQTDRILLVSTRHAAPDALLNQKALVAKNTGLTFGSPSMICLVCENDAYPVGGIPLGCAYLIWTNATACQYTDCRGNSGCSVGGFGKAWRWNPVVAVTYQHSEKDSTS